MPDLAVVTDGDTSATATQAAIEALQCNLAAYREVGQAIAERRSGEDQLENPEFQEWVFAYGEGPAPKDRIAA